MSDSKYRPLVEQTLQENNNDPFVLEREFSAIVKTTEISYAQKGKKTTVTYYDDANAVICVFEGLQGGFPKLGSVKEINRRAEYLKKYGSETVSFHIKLTHRDADVIKYLQSKENKQGYIKQLIRDDMRRNGESQGAEER